MSDNPHTAREEVQRLKGILRRTMNRVDRSNSEYFKPKGIEKLLFKPVRTQGQ